MATDEYRLTKEESRRYTNEILGAAANRKALLAQDRVAALESRIGILEGMLERISDSPPVAQEKRLMRIEAALEQLLAYEDLDFSDDLDLPAYA